MLCISKYIYDIFFISMCIIYYNIIIIAATIICYNINVIYLAR